MDLNCAGLSRELLETELFGHEKGAFTGAVAAKPGLLEVAHRGTLFLDEIGDMDPPVQPKLLKVLEEKRFRRLGDVRDRAGGRAADRRHAPGPARGWCARSASAATSTSASAPCRCACRRCASAPRTSRCSRAHLLARHRARTWAAAALRARAGGAGRARGLRLARQHPRAAQRAGARRAALRAARRPVPRATCASRPARRRRRAGGRRTSPWRSWSAGTSSGCCGRGRPRGARRAAAGRPAQLALPEDQALGPLVQSLESGLESRRPEPRRTQAHIRRRSQSANWPAGHLQRCAGVEACSATAHARSRTASSMTKNPSRTAARLPARARLQGGLRG